MQLNIVLATGSVYKESILVLVPWWGIMNPRLTENGKLERNRCCAKALVLLERRWKSSLQSFLLILAVLCSSVMAKGALQFDVFFGYDGIVPEASWFPVVCEIKNDGPAFTAIVELTQGNINQGHVRRTLVELPTGTLKRLVIPAFASARGFASWDVRLLDEKGKVLDEKTALRPRKLIGAGTPLLGSLPRTAGGTPVIEPIKPQTAELQPASARMLPSIFPDNPLVLEGMDSIYLNSEKVVELNETQVNALIAWLNAGGHLIVGVEQIRMSIPASGCGACFRWTSRA